MALGYEAGGWEYRVGEHHIYGSSRIGVHQTNLLLRSRFDEGDILVTLEDVDYTSLYRGKRHYELSNHLGNVQVVVSDKRISVCDEELEVEYFKADVLAAMDYYPFGMLSKTPPPGDQDTLLRNPDRSASEVSGMMPDRQWYANSDSSAYRFGFNGMERDNEVSGQGNNLDFGARIYDSRLGRWLSVDPLFSEYVSLSPFVFAKNGPTYIIDPDGQKIVVVGGIGYRAHVASQLIYLAMKSKTARGIILDVIRSKHTLVIASNPDQEIGVYDYDSGGEGGIMKARMTYNIETAHKELDPANGADGKSLVSIPSITLIHEIAHFHQFITTGKVDVRPIINPDNPVIKEYEEWGGTSEYVYDNNTFPAAELYAVEVENKVRAEMGLTLRTHYKGVEVINMEVSTEMAGFEGVDGKVGTGYYLVKKSNPVDWKQVASENTEISFDEAYSLIRQNHRSEPAHSHGFGNSKVRCNPGDGQCESDVYE